jgi:hypothetical protein
LAEAEIDLSTEIAAFLRDRQQLRETYDSQWVVFASGQFQRAFPDYEHAARFAIERFRGRGFLVRNLDADEEHVPLIFTDPE